MNDVVIRVENLCKEYNLGTISHGTLYRDLQSRWANFREKEDPNARIGSINHEQLNTTNDRFCALKDVSFNVHQGEIVGIIGRNGAGKSTLLKIISRVTAPTSGTIKIKGRVASLLEVGTGFHPELTGRENIFLNGAILGMYKGEIEQKFDEIVTFSEIDKFIDTPVKRYSSGMYVRLAFAVAAHLEPEILVIDEVLAVGDAQFQKKCLGKMGKVAKEGRTVLFVSHNMTAVQILCDNGIVLENGHALDKVNINDAITKYSNQINIVQNILFPLIFKDFSIYQFTVLQNGYIITEFDGGSPIDIEIEFEAFKELTFFRIGIFIKSKMGDLICRSLLADWDEKLSIIKKGYYQLKCRIPKDLLIAGEYYIQMHSSRYGITDYMLENYLSKTVVIKPPVTFNPSYIGERPFGIVCINPQWQLERIY